MSSNKTVSVTSSEEMIHELAKYIVLERSKFTKMGPAFVYTEPLKSSRKVSFDGETYFDQVVYEDGRISNLNLVEQILLLQLLSERYGLHLRHGSLRENLEAFYSRNGEAYRSNVLFDYRVFTGELILRLANAHRVGKIKTVETIPDPCDDYVHFEGDPYNIRDATFKSRIRFRLGPVLQTEIPTRFGFVTDQIKGAIPVDYELTYDDPRKQDPGACKQWDLGAKNLDGFRSRSQFIQDVNEMIDVNVKYKRFAYCFAPFWQFDGELSAVECHWADDIKTILIDSHPPLSSPILHAVSPWADDKL